MDDYELQIALAEQRIKEFIEQRHAEVMKQVQDSFAQGRKFLDELFDS